MVRVADTRCLVRPSGSKFTRFAIRAQQQRPRMLGTGKCVAKMARLLQDRRNLQSGSAAGAQAPGRRWRSPLWPGPSRRLSPTPSPLHRSTAIPPPLPPPLTLKHHKAYTNLALAAFAAHNLSTRVHDLVFVLHGQFILGQTSLSQVQPASDVLLRAHSLDCKARLDLAKPD